MGHLVKLSLVNVVVRFYIEATNLWVEVIMIRLLVLATLLALCAAATHAATPISVRILGGVTGALESGLAYESETLTPTFGFGIRYSISESHSIFIDAERIRRWSDNSPLASMPRFEPVQYRMTSYPITLGYQFAPWPFIHRLTPFLVAGITRAKLELSSTEPLFSELYPPLNPGDETPFDNTLSEWHNGLLVGMGCSTQLGTRVSLAGVMLYRSFRDVHGLTMLYSATGRPDTRQNEGGIIIDGALNSGDRNGSLSGLEARVVLEVRL